MSPDELLLMEDPFTTEDPEGVRPESVLGPEGIFGSKTVRDGDAPGLAEATFEADRSRDADARRAHGADALGAREAPRRQGAPPA
jgi:hypothetical protein